MTDSVWQLDLAEQAANSQIDQLSTGVLLSKPQAGWQSVNLAGNSLPFTPAQIWLGQAEADTICQPASMHVRGADCIASYLPTAGRNFSAQIYRTLKRVPVGTDELAVMSTMISIHTYLLDALPTIKLRTDFSAPGELLVATDQGFAEPNQTGKAEAALVRPSEGKFSYLELWHSIDYQSFHAEGQSWEHAFSEPLEKGVIRRMRVWGTFLPRADDLVLAEAVRQEFAQAAPPLTT